MYVMRLYFICESCMLNHGPINHRSVATWIENRRPYQDPQIKRDPDL